MQTIPTASSNKQYLQPAVLCIITVNNTYSQQYYYCKQYLQPGSSINTVTHCYHQQETSLRRWCFLTTTIFPPTKELPSSFFSSLLSCVRRARSLRPQRASTGARPRATSPPPYLLRLVLATHPSPPPWRMRAQPASALVARCLLAASLLVRGGLAASYYVLHVRTTTAGSSGTTTAF